MALKDAMRMRLFYQCVLVLSVSFWSLMTSWTALAQMDLTAGRTGGPISISAEQLEASDLDGRVVFLGTVVARQGELTITCDQMRVYYTSADESRPASDLGAADSASPLNPAAPGSGRSIERVECEGQVRIAEGDRLAVGQKAVYLAASEPRRIILTGQARVWQGQDSVSGHQITYFLDSGRSLVEGQDQERVRANYQGGGGGK